MRALDVADRLMDDFCARTGVDGGGTPDRRYLWTDALAVEACVTLHARTGMHRHLERAVHLAELVHRVLGRHRPDDRRTGWISGLDEASGERRPTAGGLRIGKPLPERPVGAPRDDGLEWDRDGQYFHYHTRWIHALCDLAEATGDVRWLHHAIDLSHASCAAFVVQPGSSAGARPRMHWKMSIDLSRPLVAAMGHLDPFDGFVALARVQASVPESDPERARLDAHMSTLRSACDEVPTFATSDPLTLGGLLEACGHFADLVAEGEHPFDHVLGRALADARCGVDAFAGGGWLLRPLDARLPFRELGLAIGLKRMVPMLRAVKSVPSRFRDGWTASELLASLEPMAAHAALARRIEEAWASSDAQSHGSWREHLDINAATLAACLADHVQARRHVRPTA
jgi:hypothetical protein